MRKHIVFTNFAIIMMLAGLLVSCSSRAEPPVTGNISLQPNNNVIEVGQTAILSIPVVGGNEIKFKWTATRGSLTAADTAAPLYTAPSSPGPDGVTVEVSGKGGVSVKGISLTIVEPPPTPSPVSTSTPVPTDTPLPTATELPTETPEPTQTPEPLDCRHPSITRYVFPQLESVEDQFPFYGPLGEPKFNCQGVYTRAHSEPVSVRLEYTVAGNNYGFWGIGTPKGFDASDFNEVCFWVYAEEPAQAFYLQIRDTRDVEKKVQILHDLPGEWKEYCTALSEFSKQGVQLDRVENFNLGFNDKSGSALIWVDDFELR